MVYKMLYNLVESRIDVQIGSTQAIPAGNNKNRPQNGKLQTPTSLVLTVAPLNRMASAMTSKQGRPTARPLMQLARVVGKLDITNNQWAP